MQNSFVRDIHIPTYTPTFSLWYNLNHGEEVEKININQITARLRALRLSRHLTQQELAERCRFPGPWKVSRLENGGKGSGITDLTTLEIVCQELGIELWELLKSDEEASALPPETKEDE